MIAPPRFLLVTALLAAVSTQPVRAERADSDKPTHLEANRVSVDDVKRVHVFEGKVTLTRGTMLIRAAKLVMTEDAEGYQKGIGTGGEGGLVFFRQKREGKDEYVEGEAERLEYDARTEKTEFFNRVRIKSGADELRGEYISYDGRTEQFIATPGTGAGGKGGRVTAIIQPKKNKNPPAGE